MATAELPNPFEFDAPSQFVLDVNAFLDAIMPPPVFLSDPSPEYMTAVELMPIVEVLAAHQ
jgi:hypothetical protein